MCIRPLPCVATKKCHVNFTRLFLHAELSRISYILPIDKEMKFDLDRVLIGQQ